MIWFIKRGETNEDLTQLIAAWVTPRDDEIQKLIHESAINPNAKAVGGLLGYQKTEHLSEMKEEITLPPGTHYLWKLHLRQGCQINGLLTKVYGQASKTINTLLGGTNPPSASAPKHILK